MSSGAYQQRKDGCSTVVEHMPKKQEVVGLNPFKCLALYPIFSVVRP